MKKFKTNATEEELVIVANYNNMDILSYTDMISGDVIAICEYKPICHNFLFTEVSDVVGHAFNYSDIA